MAGTKTYVAKPGEIEKRWWLIDGNEQVVGRIASEIATILIRLLFLSLLIMYFPFKPSFFRMIFERGLIIRRLKAFFNGLAPYFSSNPLVKIFWNKSIQIS